MFFICLISSVLHKLAKKFRVSSLTPGSFHAKWSRKSA